MAIVVREGTDGLRSFSFGALTIRAMPGPGHYVPRGREDPQDENLLATAIRETLEEVGSIFREAGRLLGQLATGASVARGRPVEMTIVPFILSSWLTRNCCTAMKSSKPSGCRSIRCSRGNWGTTFAVYRDAGANRPPRS